jgi:hypothetical protein
MTRNHSNSNFIELIEFAILDREKSLHIAARQILDYEQCFWDTIYKYSIIN